MKINKLLSGDEYYDNTVFLNQEFKFSLTLEKLSCEFGYADVNSPMQMPDPYTILIWLANQLSRLKRVLIVSLATFYNYIIINNILTN